MLDVLARRLDQARSGDGGSGTGVGAGSTTGGATGRALGRRHGVEGEATIPVSDSTGRKTYFGCTWGRSSTRLDALTWPSSMCAMRSAKEKMRESCVTTISARSGAGGDFFEQLDHRLGRFGVERGRRLVAHEQSRRVHERARDRDALLLAPGKFRGQGTSRDCRMPDVARASACRAPAPAPWPSQDQQRHRRRFPGRSRSAAG
jgi:hypothetical protein